MLYREIGGYAVLTCTADGCAGYVQVPLRWLNEPTWKGLQELRLAPRPVLCSVCRLAA